MGYGGDMRIVIPGGTGQVGGILRRRYAAAGHDVVVLSRQPETLEPGVRHRVWDGRSVGDWAEPRSTVQTSSSTSPVGR